MENQVNESQGTHAGFLDEIESKQILKQAGLTVIEPVLAGSPTEAVFIADKMGYPVVLKLVSRDITHKSDSGGVVTGISDSERLVQAYTDIISAVRKNHPEALITGISVQKQAPAGIEVIIGMTRDPQFGPVIMFGLGGVWVEIFNDVSLRIAPLTREDAAEMIRELKSYKLLQGFRGRPGVNTGILEDWLLIVSELATRNSRIKELDINPIFVNSESATAADARILLEGQS